MAKGKAGLVLAIIAGAGMVYTVIMTAKKAPEAKEAKDAALKQKREETGDDTAELTRMEAFKAQAPCYFPVALGAGATLVSVVGSQFLPQKTLNDLEKWKKTYQAVSARLNGVQGEKLMSQITSQQLISGNEGIKKETFIVSCEGTEVEFESTIVDVLDAEYNIDRLFCGKGDISFNEALDFFHAEQHIECGEKFGWDIYLGDTFYGYSWIDFTHRRGMKDGRPVTFIEFPFPPHSLYESDLDDEIIILQNQPRTENIT